MSAPPPTSHSNDEEEDSHSIVQSASSPTQTIRQSNLGSQSTAAQTFAEILKSPAPQSGPEEGTMSSGLAAAPELKRSGSQQQQEALGKGRPGSLHSQQQDEQRPNPISTPQPAPSSSQYHAALSPGRASSIRSFTTATEDEDYYDAQNRPRSALPGAQSLESTPRGGIGSQRGPPATAFGSSFGSPNTTWGERPGNSNAGSMPRPPRNPRFLSSGMYQAPPGSMSRSASRARPVLQQRESVVRVDKDRDRKDGDREDEEVEDRGAELIKQRQKERRQARKKKAHLELEKRLAAEAEAEGLTPLATPDLSAPTTGLPDERFQTQQQRGGPGTTSRSISRSRAPSSDRRRYPSEAGYFPRPASLAGTETPRDGGLSPRDDFLRAPSVHSAQGDEEDQESIAADQASIVDEIVHDVVEEEIGGEHGTDVEDEDEDDEGDGGDEGVTLRDRQDALNIEHPFGLPIWKPALYRKSRSVTRNAESALHSIPSAAAERHLLPGNILWVLLFGWWLALACFFVAVLVSAAEVLGGGRGGYGKTLRGLAWYIGWPFGKYVEGEGAPEEDPDNSDDEDESARPTRRSDYGTWTSRSSSSVSPTPKARVTSDGASSNFTIRNTPSRDSLGLHAGLPDEPIRPSLAPTSPAGASSSTIRGADGHDRQPTVTFSPNVKVKDMLDDERTSLLGNGKHEPKGFRRPRNKKAKFLGRLVYWPGFFLVVAPIMSFVCILCWFFVITIPMAKLTWALLNLLYHRPLEINFRSAPKVVVPIPTGNTPHGSPDSSEGSGTGSGSTTLQGEDGSPSGYTMKRAHLTAGQVAPTSGPRSTVLLCTYRAVGLQYYKYTVGGVNIMFINLLPLVFFVIIDGLFILPFVEKLEHKHLPISPLLKLITSQALIFVLSLASVIPLSYFIGMAVASISAQSSIGMGAVINATFGSIIEIILYSIALIQGKGRLVEGSIVGSILAGVLLMPGVSMCSGAFKRKEQKFNAKSAGVTSTMLIMAIIGTLTPTMFYQTYGSFELHCEGCPTPAQHNISILPDSSLQMTGGAKGSNNMWMCDHCYYEHPDPQNDPFYQDQVETLMYGCAAILLFSYLIGLWFSLRTHAAQIWQNPQQLMKNDEASAAIQAMHPAVKATLTQRITPQAVMQHILPLHKANVAGNSPHQSRSVGGSPKASISRLPSHVGYRPSPVLEEGPLEGDATAQAGSSTEGNNKDRSASNTFNLPAGYTPFLESVDKDLKNSQTHLTPMRLPSSLTTEDFTRAVAVATVSALRHQGSIIGSSSQSGSAQKSHDEEQGHGGHEAPSWTRGVSAGVLLGCTLLYAIIAEILVDVVDVVLQGSGIDEKFLGLTLFALVPNTTEFMNAMSFALNGNIALSMEIGSAYALQVCLLQIPAMVAFSALYQPDKMGDVVDTFTLIFPRWDVIAIILSIFLLTYTYIEARSNYHRGSILVLAYIVLIMGFYYAPIRSQGDTEPDMVYGPEMLEDLKTGLGVSITKLWA
uniref:Calcium/proton exchanger n=1 Tax=Kwoniella dejecticola CBS 10117 TaxID=1296121 RepID=A0A1A6AAK9_9TREE|nr:calcium/proton exchanger [Kwoniella dejecticola CBS 10117]OBR87102.1 calcium/proton exchanger [Kwoniella dejecticola CBS 10117]